MSGFGGLANLTLPSGSETAYKPRKRSEARVVYTHVAALAVGLAVGSAGAWKVQAWRWDSADLARVAAEQEAKRMNEKAASQASAGFEAARGKTERQIQVVEREVERVVEKPVYRELCLSDDGLRLLRAAASGANP